MPAPSHFPRPGHPPLTIDALAWYPDDGMIRNKMTFTTHRDEVVPLWYDRPDMEGFVGVARTLADIGPLTIEDRGAGAFTFEAEFTSDLRPEQVPFVAGCFKMLEDEHGGIGEAPTGFGKTVVGCNLITKIGRPTCIVIPKGDLDWKPELLAHTTIPEDKISLWQGQQLPDPNAWVVIASLQSIYREGVYPAELYRRFGCVMFDEVHRLGAPEFSAAIRKFSAFFRLGLSATPERRDGKMDLIHAHLGWRHVVGKTDAEQPDYFVIPTNWTEPRDKENKPIKFDPARTNYAKKSLMSDMMRNAAIAGGTYRAHKAGRRTIVFIEQIKHGEKIKKALRAAGVPENMILEYNGSTSKEGRAFAKTCPAGIVLIATYKFTAEGTNIPLLDCAVLAHPIFDPRQAAGRVTRKPPPGMTKPTPVVLDVWDVQSPALKHIATARWNYLKQTGARWKGEFR